MLSSIYYITLPVSGSIIPAASPTIKTWCPYDTCSPPSLKLATIVSTLIGFNRYHVLWLTTVTLSYIQIGYNLKIYANSPRSWLILVTCLYLSSLLSDNFPRSWPILVTYLHSSSLFNHTLSDLDYYYLFSLYQCTFSDLECYFWLTSIHTL